MDVATCIQASYVSAATAILLIRAVPSLRDRFLAYGSRAATSDATPGDSSTAGLTVVDKAEPEDWSTAVGIQKSGERHVTRSDWEPGQLLDSAAALQVPHAWFTSFYVVSTISSLFWALQVLSQGPAFRLIVSMTATANQSMGPRQILVTWAMMLTQGARRLYESLQYSKPSSTSKMFIGHWIMGIWFYITIGVAVWIEGIPVLQTPGLEVKHFQFVPPSPRTFVAFTVFVLASGAQRDCHAYLASLKQYTVPAHPAFHAVVCPHYFAECLIYLSLAFQAAPKGTLFNRTILSAFVFVAVNLGVTADGTKGWYQRRFGPKSVESKARMIPHLF